MTVFSFVTFECGPSLCLWTTVGKVTSSDGWGRISPRYTFSVGVSLPFRSIILDNRTTKPRLRVCTTDVPVSTKEFLLEGGLPVTSGPPTTPVPLDPTRFDYSPESKGVRLQDGDRVLSSRKEKARLFLGL